MLLYCRKCPVLLRPPPVSTGASSLCHYSISNEQGSIALHLPYILGNSRRLGGAGLIGTLVWILAQGKGLDL